VGESWPDRRLERIDLGLGAGAVECVPGLVLLLRGVKLLDLVGAVVAWCRVVLRIGWCCCCLVSSCFGLGRCCCCLVSSCFETCRSLGPACWR